MARIFQSFLVSGLLEGAITLAVVQALERMQPGFVRKPAAGRPVALGAVGLATVLLAAVGVLFASADPGGIWRLAECTGIAPHARALLVTPLTGYQAAFVQSDLLRQLPQAKVLVTHHVPFAQAIWARAVFFQQGTIIAEGGVAEIARRFDWGLPAEPCEGR